MKCYAYKSFKKADTFLYLGVKGRFDILPDELLALFGEPGFVLEFELTEHRTLAQADARQVMANLNEHGYYLQMPPQHHTLTG